MPLRATGSPVPCSRSRSASSGWPPRWCPCRSTSGPRPSQPPRRRPHRPKARQRPRRFQPRQIEEEARMVPTDLRYTKDHEWVRVDGDQATVGVTEFAAQQLGDVVFVDLPASGRDVEQHGTFGVVESVKAVSDLYAPIAGEVVEANAALADRPELVNSDPFGEGWMIRLKLADATQLDGLLDAAAYEALIASS